MTELLLLRHGQSQAQSGEDPDQVNPALTALGVAQAPRIAIVGHWWIFTALFRAFCGNGTAALPAVIAAMDNCAMSRLHVDECGQRVIAAWNDLRHLPHAGR
jgi:broad specificity phosphatase PhoE